MSLPKRHGLLMMTMQHQTHIDSSRRLSPVLLVPALIVAELLVLSVAYTNNFTFTCRDVAPDAFCAFAGRIVPRGIGVLVGLSLFLLARPKARAILFESRVIRLGALALNLTGFLVIMSPWTVLSDASGPAAVSLAIFAWVLGGIAAAVGAALLLAPFTTWRQLAGEHGWTLLALIAVGLALPELSDQLAPLWYMTEWVTEATFAAVVWSLEALGYVVETDLETKGIGAENFFVRVGSQCSGVEGFALITIFLTLYLALFRKDLRFPHVLVLFPVGLLLSSLFNVLRITVLLVLGIEVSPELAINGFHSHAGWLTFTVLSIGLILISRSIPVFRRSDETATAPLSPFFRDPEVARILPFIVFMASALLASTFSETPALLYPWRAAAVAAVLALFWPYLRSLPWRLDPLALGSGLIIGAAWIASGPAAAESDLLAGMTGVSLTIWVVTRMLGTTILVPVLEELLFRGYVVSRIAPSGTGVRMGIAVLVSAVLFALLHDRWLAAGLAGVVFGLLVWRSRNITDAIVSHAAANGTIALWALLTGAWHVI